MKNIKEKLISWFKGEKLKGSAICALVIGVIIAFNAIVYAFTVAFNLYLYSPEVDDLTISGSTDALFADAMAEAKENGEKIRIVFCRTRSQFDPSSSTYTDDEVNKFYITAKQFEEKYPDFIELAYVNLLTKRMSVGDSDKEELIDLTELQVKDESGSGDEYYPLYNSSIIFLSNKEGREKRYIQDITAAAYVLASAETGEYSSYNGEEIIASMTMWVLADEHKTAYFTTHHGEVADITFANILSCAGYSIETLDLRQADYVPKDADLLVISNPTKDFETSGNTVYYPEIEKLDRYLKEGGNLYVTLDPYVKKLHVLEGLLEKYGISFAESEDGKLRHIVKDNDNAITADGFTLVADYADSALANKIESSVRDYNEGNVVLKEAAALKLDGKLGAMPVLLSSGASSVYEGGDRVGSEGYYCVGAVSRFAAKDGKESNIFVLPSVYISANDALSKKGYSNRDFLYSVFDNVFGVENVPYGCTPVYRRDAVLENLTMKSARLYTALILSIPAIITVVGSVIIIKRKNR